MPSSLDQLHKEVESCQRCDRLRAYCTDVAQTKRRQYLNWNYWGRPVPGFGDAKARLWIIGLAPAAHGGNRTGRVFTGDRSGDFLYGALHRAGFANQPESISRDDGLKLRDCYISATARCAPPANKPTPEQVSNCSTFLDREWSMLGAKCVILALGKIAWDATLALGRRNECLIPKPVPLFSHGAQFMLQPRLTLLGSYHVSQQNTFTGKLTTEMFDEVLRQASRAMR